MREKHTYFVSFGTTRKGEYECFRIKAYNRLDAAFNAGKMIKPEWANYQLLEVERVHEQHE